VFAIIKMLNLLKWADEVLKVSLQWVLSCTYGPTNIGYNFKSFFLESFVQKSNILNVNYEEVFSARFHPFFIPHSKLGLIKSSWIYH